MKLVDANVLLYAVNAAAPQHEQARGWIDRALSGEDTVGLAWQPLLAFVRISTRPGLFPRPLSTAQAMEVVQAWLAQPASRVVVPSARHPFVLADLIGHVGVGGNLVNDAHLATLAIEHRATVITYDTDFARFPGVRWQVPD